MSPFRSKFTVNGETSVHIMRESLFQFSVSYVMQKDSPYTSRWKHLTLRLRAALTQHLLRFSEKLDQLKQSGLIDHWMNNEFEKIARLQDTGKTFGSKVILLAVQRSFQALRLLLKD